MNLIKSPKLYKKEPSTPLLQFLFMILSLLSDAKKISSTEKRESQIHFLYWECRVPVC